MPDRFRHKYRIPSARLPNWNYSSNGYYFITVCTQNRERFFGEIVQTHDCAPVQMQLSEIGRIAKEYWLKIRDHFPFVALDESVVMPNHIHGIVVIENDEDIAISAAVETQNSVETQNFASLQSSKQQNKFGPQSKNLASIIRGYKTGVKKYATMNNIDFAWQPRFYDHIIRDEQSLYRIREYIQKNPINWDKDRNRPDNFAPSCNL